MFEVTFKISAVTSAFIIYLFIFTHLKDRKDETENTTLIEPLRLNSESESALFVIQNV